jgi:hypothetical protein
MSKRRSRPEPFDWSAPQLDPADQRLAGAYATVGRPLNDLAYTDEFKRLCALAGCEETDEARYSTYKRLLGLKTRGRLPSLDDWNAGLLEQVDPSLLDAYVAIGRPIEDLAYTDDFKRLGGMLGYQDTDDARYLLYRRLERLDGRGKLASLPWRAYRRKHPTVTGDLSRNAEA